MSVIRDIATQIANMRHNLTLNRESDVLAIALDHIALIKLRIQSSGVDADGKDFAPYVPPYARKRKAGGYQVGFVDFTVTGRLMASVRPTIVQSNEFACTVELGAVDDRGKTILTGAEKKRGVLIRPSKEEIKIVENANRERILKYIKFR
jgi:hypothetical protein